MPTEQVKPEAEKTYTGKDVQDLFASFMVPMSKEAINNLSADLTPEKFTALEDYAKTTAMGLYPTLAKQIQSGIPVHHLMEPYRQVGKQMLGEQFEPDFVGDPKSSMALSGGSDAETGRPAPMSLDQWRAHLVNERSFGWEFTPAAHEASQKVIDAINAGFSQRPTGGAQ
jgi:hypothetical protein